MDLFSQCYSQIEDYRVEDDTKSLNGYNQVKYRASKNVMYGESAEQAERLDDLEAVVCSKCFFVHQDSPEEHQCNEQYTVSEGYGYYDDDVLKDLNRFNNLHYRKEHEIKFGETLDEAKRLDTNQLRICEQCYIVYREPEIEKHVHHSCSLKEALSQ